MRNLSFEEMLRVGSGCGRITALVVGGCAIYGGFKGYYREETTVVVGPLKAAGHYAKKCRKFCAAS